MSMTIPAPEFIGGPLCGDLVDEVMSKTEIHEATQEHAPILLISRPLIGKKVVANMPATYARTPSGDYRHSAW